MSHIVETDLRKAARQNYQIDAGNDWSHLQIIKDKVDGNPVIVEGGSGTFKAWRPSSTALVVDLSFGNGMTVSDGNKIAIVPPVLTVGDYEYEQVLTTLSGEVYRIKGLISSNEE